MKKLLGDTFYNDLIEPENITEIRLRAGKRTEIKTVSGLSFHTYIPTEQYIHDLLQRAMRFSPYAYEEEISEGFVHYNGGIRIGISGMGKVREGDKLSFSTVTSLCIRIPHQIVGVSDRLGIFYKDFQSTLIISPPYCGKTTLIRDMARVLSDHYDTLYIDEREELCGGGRLQTGKRADVISGIPKRYLYENIIRAMSPEIVVCDELFSEEDYIATSSFIRSGVRCLASFHAVNYDDLPISLKSTFKKFVILTKDPTVGTIKGTKRND